MEIIEEIKTKTNRKKHFSIGKQTKKVSKKRMTMNVVSYRDYLKLRKLFEATLLEIEQGKNKNFR